MHSSQDEMGIEVLLLSAITFKPDSSNASFGYER